MLRQLVPSLAALLGIAACGEVKTLQPPVDSPPLPIDAPGIDAPHRGSATIHLLDLSGRGSAVTGAQVLFTDAFETQRTATDGSGFATVEIADDATVTAVANDGPGELFVQTVYHVKIGDVIELGEPNFQSMSLGNFTVNFTPVQGLGSGVATNYEVFGPCGAASVSEAPNATAGSMTLTFQANCKEDPMELLLLARNSSAGNVPIGFIDKQGVSFVAGGSTVFTGPYRPFIDFTTTVSNGSALASLDITRETPDDFGFAVGAGGSLTNGSATFVLSTPTAATAFAETSMSRANFGDQDITTKLDGSADTFAFDVGSNALPWLGPPTLDVPTKTIHFPIDTTDSSPGDTSLFFAELEYQRAAGSGSDGTPGADILWFMFSNQVEDLVLPTLPPEVTPFGPLATDEFDDLDVRNIAVDGLSADQVRAAPFAFLVDNQQALRTLTGRFRQVESNAGPGFADGSGSGAMVRAASRGHSLPPLVRRVVARAR